jgi:cobalt-zinc-cadmium efflux system protein
MIASALILGDIEGDLSMQSVMLDTVADAAAAIGVALSGAIILLTHGVYWLDSAIALAIAVVVGYHALMLMRRVLKSLSRTRVDRPSAPRSRGL